MANRINYIVVAALALAIGQPVASTFSSASLKELQLLTCDPFLKELAPFAEVRQSGEKLFAFAKNWLEQHTKPLSMGRKVIKAWQAVANDEDCSESSWMNVVLLNFCGGKRIQILKDQLTAYTDRCLTSTYVSKKIKEKTSGMFATSIDFITDDFIKRFHEDNPRDSPLHISQAFFHTDNCCRPELSKGALVQTIEQEFKAKDKDPKKEFHLNKSKLETYLNRKLIKPCKAYVKELSPVVTEALAISNHYKGGQAGLAASLDPEAKKIVFRYRYCDMLDYHNDPLAITSKHFVQ